jgi:hypothetical protein
MADEILFNTASWIICIGLFAILLGALAIGRWLGRRARANIDETAKSQASSLQGAILGLLALLLAFTLSMAISRYEARKQVIVDEANAIGTTYLRAKMLPPSQAAEAVNLLGRYVTLQLELYNAGYDQARLQAVSQQTTQLQRQLWSVATTVSLEDNRSVPAGLFVQTLNDTIDFDAKRNAAFQNRVPGVVIWLLFGVAALAVGMVGYNDGLGTRRHFIGALVIIVLLVAIIWVTIDLDLPQYGLIRVNQQSMLNLQDFITHDVP